MQTKTKKKIRCTCEAPSEYNEPKDPRNRHEVGCAKSPDVSNWLFYPYDGELDSDGLYEGGVYVNPSDPGLIYLMVKGYLCRAPMRGTGLGYC